MNQPVFTVEALCAAAVARSGRSDFGSDSYTAGLEALIFSIEHEANLTPIGRYAAAGGIVAALANRLTVVAWETDNPDLAAAPVKPPMVILGLGRTGTTILHETLAAAPGHRTLVEWEISDFSLAHDVTDPRSDERVLQINANIDKTEQLVPGFRAIHYHDAWTPSECIGLVGLDLCSEHFAATTWAPTYRKLLLSHDHRSVYSWHRRGLRYFQATTPDVRWVLKAPCHAAYLPELLETYPDAMVISPHRDPMEVVASLCSLYATLRPGFSDDVDVEEQAAADATYAADIVQRSVDFRRANPDVDARICDIGFKEFLADQNGTLASIYAHFGLDLDEGARDAMVTYLENRPREKYGRHVHSLEQFGLSPDELAPLFADYTERFASFW